MSKSGGSSSSMNQSNSSSYGYDAAFSDAFNRGQSVSNSFNQGMGENFTQSGSSTFVDPSQSPFRDQLFKNAQAAYDGFTMPQQGQQYDTLIDNYWQAANPAATVEARLEGLQSGLFDQFQTGLNTIGAEASSAGAYGGGRHAIREAELGGELGKAYTQGYGDIMAQATEQALTANAGFGAALDAQRAGALQSQFGGLQALQGLLGAPTILSQSGSTGYGYDTSTGGSSSLSASEGGSSSRSFGEQLAQMQSMGTGREQKFGFGIK